jgi:F-box/WD-40 domain protein MET30
MRRRGTDSQQELETLSSSDQQGISHVWSLFSAAPSKHRNLMLQGILTQCCFPQLSYLSTAVRDLIRIDFISACPPEISYKILCYLDTTSLCKAAQVSRRWRSMADDDEVWHKMCEQHIDRKCIKCGWGLPLMERKQLRDWKRERQLRGAGRGLNQWSPELTPLPESSQTSSSSTEVAKLTPLPLPRKRDASTFSADLPDTPEAAKRSCTRGLNTDASDASFTKPLTRPWKEVYSERFKVGTNWKYGRCSTKVFKGHTNGIMCIQFDDNILATGSYDCTIKIWDVETGKQLRTLKGHTSGIRALQFDDTKLISGSLDSTLKVWNWRTGECISTYPGHQAGVVCLNFQGNLLASGSIDKTIKIWNFSDQTKFSLRGHTDWVNAVKLDTASRTLFSASDDCTIRLWDLDTKTCIKVFEGHVGQVQQVLPLPADYEPEDADIDEDRSDTASTTSHHELNSRPTSPPPQPFGPLFAAGRPAPPRYMLTGALDSTVRLWDVATGKCIKTMFGHVEGVWAVAADTLRVISGAEDRMVKVWDARTGRCERTFGGHEGPVTCVALSDSRMCSGSEDCEVRMYSFKADECDAAVVGTLPH